MRHSTKACTRFARRNERMGIGNGMDNAFATSIEFAYELLMAERGAQTRQFHRGHRPMAAGGSLGSSCTIISFQLRS